MNSPMNDEHNLNPDEIELLSKTSMKKEMQKLQDLGIELTLLKPQKLAAMPISDELRDAIELLHKLTHNEAVRRQKQFIGKLMRHEDTDAIEKAFNNIAEKQNREARLLKTIERWRDNLIAGEASVAESFIDSFPNCDRQQLRQLIKGAKSEFGRPKPPTFTRKLFTFLRDIITAEPEQD
jgi:ribosome-associated protein